MKTRTLIFGLSLLLSNNFSFAQHYKVLHSFSGPPSDASYVISRLAMDAKGNLYGTSANGGANLAPGGQTFAGSVFMLTPKGDGTWNESVIYSFCSNSDGYDCFDGDSAWAGVVLDEKGNLYGTTFEGGTGASSFMGGGVAYELFPPQQLGGAWTESVLYNFCSLSNCADGDTLTAPLTFDAQGNLYGTTAEGGTGHVPPDGGGGTVFKLSPGAKGWTESVLYDFCSVGTGEICPDGSGPYLAGVVFDSTGNLYGTTGTGGQIKNTGAGAVYKLTPGTGKWKEQVLAADPVYDMSAGLSGGVALDPSNNIYGTSLSLKGAVYRLDPTTKQKKLFLFNGTDGGGPIAGVTLDLKHNLLYGTTAGAGEGGVEGIYKIDLTTWKETMLYQFCSQQNCTDGDTPWPTMIMDKDGNLYGTTEFGGEYGNGVVFEYTP